MNNIKKRRIDMKLTQNNIASLLGVDRSTVTKWETNHSMPRLDLLQKLQQVKLNQKNGEHALSDILGLNFTKHDYYMRLSYDDNHMPSCIEDAERQLQNFIKRVNYRRHKLGLSKLRYVYFTEQGTKSGRVHHHIFLDGDMSRDDYESIWGLGYANSRRLRPGPDGFLGIAIYSSKKKRAMLDDEQPEGRQSKSFRCSLGLQRPELGREISQNDYRIKSRDTAYIDEHPDDFRYIERLYPGYLVHTVETTPCDMRVGRPMRGCGLKLTVSATGRDLRMC